MWHARGFGPLFLVVLVSTITPIHTVHAQPSIAVRPQYYLVLGDSHATGYQPLTGAGDRRCSNPAKDASGRGGYACLILTRLKRVNSALQYRNVARLGETTCSFLAITPCPGQENRHRQSQLHDALQFLRQHQGQVGIISLEIGQNDLEYGLLSPALRNLETARRRVPTVTTQLRTNYDAIVRQLQAAAPKAQLLIINVYNPLSGVPLPAKERQGEEFYDQVLRDHAAFVNTEGAMYQAIPVDVRTPFLGQVGQFTHREGNDAHANDRGQRLYAAILWQSYQAHLLGVEPVTLSLRLIPSPLHPGQPATLLVKTLPGAEVAVQLVGAQGQARLQGIADQHGEFRAAWQTSRHAGRVRVRACASLHTVSLCLEPTLFVG